MNVVLSLVFSHLIVFIQCGIVTFLTESKTSCNPDLIVCKSWETYTTKNDPSTYLFNTEGNIIKPGLNNINVYFKMHKRPIGKRNESIRVADINSNMCSFFKKHTRRDPFASYFVNVVRRYGKIPSCPIKPGLYYIHNLTINGFDFPSFSGLFLGNSEVSLVFQVYATYRKKVVPLANFTFAGGYRSI